MKEIYRNYDNKHSINNHSVRIFDLEWFGKVYVNRCTDVGYYTVCEMPYDFDINNRVCNVGKQIMEFDNMSWTKAIQKISEYMENTYNLAD